jgi:hypothetical protein
MATVTPIGDMVDIHTGIQHREFNGLNDQCAGIVAIKNCPDV